MGFFDVHDDFAWLDPFGHASFTVFASPRLAKSLKVIDTDDYEVFPKKAFLEREIKAKEEEIARLKEQKDHLTSQIDSNIKKKEEEIDTLRGRMKELSQHK